jgi:hypothetical protein
MGVEGKEKGVIRPKINKNALLLFRIAAFSFPSPMTINECNPEDLFNFFALQN